MELITKDGKDYLKSSVLKVDSKHIEYSKFFEDLEECKNYCLELAGKESEDKIDFGEYGSSIQSILSRFSGEYFSPSFMKSFETNPATTLMGSFAYNDINSPLTIGTTVHRIFELYYKQDKKDRKREDLIRLTEENILEGQSKEELLKYIYGYMDICDYLNKDIILDDTNLDCFCEYKGKRDIYIPKFGIGFKMPISFVVDRIDVRDDGLYILDYKTGHQTQKSATFDGYLGSMILYKWVVEQEFSMEVKGGYLVAPQNKEKYIKLDYTLVNESRLVDEVISFIDNFKMATESKILEFTNDGYFTSDDLKKFRQVMNADNDICDYEVEVYVGEHKEEK